MDFLTPLLCLSFAWLLARVLLFIRRANSHQNLPPGPAPLPIIGNLHQLGSKPHKSFAALAKTYGHIMTLQLGQITTVVFSSPAAAKQVLQKLDVVFSNRPNPDSINAANHNQYSVAWIPVSPKWRALRKIYNSHIFSTQKLDANQHLRSQKVQDLIDEVHKLSKAGAAVDIGSVVFRTTLNLLSNTVFSLDLANQSSDTTRELKEIVSAVMEYASKPNLADYFPILRKVDPQRIRGRMTIEFGKMFQLFRRLIEERLETNKHGDINSDDVLSTLLDIMKSQSGEINRTHVDHLLLDLFGAGTDTTSNTVEWAMAEMLNNPNTLTQAKTELEKTIGKGKQIEESDISQLPYMRAVVKETLRLHSVVPLLLPRKVEKDVEVCGYTVRGGSQVVVNAWAIGRDENTWENANSFMPERFLGSDIDVRGHDFELIPFGGGRRICPGLPLAIRMIHMILGSLVNMFDWNLEDGMAAEDLDMDDKFGLTLQKAKPLLAVATPIQN